MRPDRIASPCRARWTRPGPPSVGWTVIAPCFPGATVTDVDGSDFAGVRQDQVRADSPGLQRNRAFTEARSRGAPDGDPRSTAQDRRGNGTALRHRHRLLRRDGAACTDVQLVTDLSITGRPAQFGGGVITDVSDKLLDLFVELRRPARFTDGRVRQPTLRPDRRRADRSRYPWWGWRTRPSGDAEDAPSGCEQERSASVPAPPRSRPRGAVAGLRTCSSAAAGRRYQPPPAESRISRRCRVVAEALLAGAGRAARWRCSIAIMIIRSRRRSGERARSRVRVNVCVALHRDGRWLLTVRATAGRLRPGTIGLVGGHLERHVDGRGRVRITCSRTPPGVRSPRRPGSTCPASRWPTWTASCSADRWRTSGPHRDLRRRGPGRSVSRSVAAPEPSSRAWAGGPWRNSKPTPAARRGRLGSCRQAQAALNPA